MATSNFKKILVPLDGSKNASRAFDKALQIAKQCKSGLTAISVLPFPAVQTYQPDRIAKEKMYDEAKKLLESAKSIATKKGIFLQSKILEGSHPGSVVVAFSKKGNGKFDLIIIGSRGRSGLKEKLLGSTSNYVMHKSDIPVMVVK